jgi:hypothetical protein
MSNIIWHWAKGGSKIYTRSIYVAEKARREGNVVMPLKEKPHIFTNLKSNTIISMF